MASFPLTLLSREVNMGLTNGFTRIVLSGRLQRHQAESITVVRSKSSVFEDKSSFGDYAELTAGLAPPLYSGFLQRQEGAKMPWMLLLPIDDGKTTTNLEEPTMDMPIRLVPDLPEASAYKGEVAPAAHIALAQNERHCAFVSFSSLAVTGSTVVQAVGQVTTVAVAKLTLVDDAIYNMFSWIFRLVAEGARATVHALAKAPATIVKSLSGKQTLLSCTAGEVNDELTTIPVVPAEPETLKATVEVEVELSPMAVHEEVETNATISIDSGALTETPEPDSQDRNNDMALSLVYKWENPYLSTEESTKSSDHTGNFARVPNEGELVLSGIRSTPSTSNREGAVFDIYRDLATTTVTDSLSECFDFDTVMELLMSDDEGYEDLLPSVWANISRGAVTGPDHKLTRAATNSLTVCFDCETLPELVATDTGSMEDLLRSPWENISTATQGFLQSFFTQFATCATFPTEGQLVPIEAAVATAMERETRPDYPLSAESTAQKMETVSAATPHGPSEWVGMKSLFSQAFCPVPPGPRQCGVLEGLRASEDTAWNELPRDDAVHLPCDMDIPPSDAIIFDATDERQPSLVEDAETMQTVASLENVGASTESGAEEGLAPGWQLVLSVVFAVTLLLALRAYITWVTNCFVYSNVATSIGRKHSGRRGPRIPRPHIEPQAHPVSSSRKKKGKRGRRQQAAVSSILSSPPQPYNGAAVGAATAATTTPTTGNNHADNTAGSSSQPGS